MLIPGDEGRMMRKAHFAILGRPRLYTLIIDSVIAYQADQHQR